MSSSMPALDSGPDSFVCPLTLETMTDPVTAADGHSYENEAISQWLQSSNVSPLTNETLAHTVLVKNHALRNAIQEHQQKLAAQERERSRAVPSIAGVKLIVLGDPTVGKTSLVHRYAVGSFSQTTQSTIGCSFVPHTATLPDGAKLKLAIWDTAGQEKYRSFTRQYFRGARAALVIFDITSEASFDGARRWLLDLKRELPPSPATVVVLVGSKLDRSGERQVSPDAARALAAEEHADFIECSSKVHARAHSGTRVNIPAAPRESYRAIYPLPCAPPRPRSPTRARVLRTGRHQRGGRLPAVCGEAT